MNKFNFDVIKGYDIRSIYGEELRSDDIYLIGLSVGYWIDLNFKDNKDIVIGYDNRDSGSEIFKILSFALGKFNIKIYNIGLSSSPILSFATQYFNCCGIMITASHNNVKYNGMKISKPNFEGLDGEEIKGMIESFLNSSNFELLSIIENVNLFEVVNNANSKIEKVDIFQEYLNFLFSKLGIELEGFLDLSKNKRIAFDFLGSTVNNYVSQYLNTGNYVFVENKRLIDDPDPTSHNNLNNLKDLILKEKCDIGFAFDGDCDRVVILDENGVVTKAEHIVMILSSEIKKASEKTRVIHDVRCSYKLKNFLVQGFGCEVFESKIGHSIMKKTMKDLNSDLSAEMSGHFIFKELGFDDGFYTALFLIKFLSSQNEKLSNIVMGFPEIYCNENIKIFMCDVEMDRKLKKIEQVANILNKKIDNFDGIKIIDDYGWILFRKSKTEKCLTVKFESFRSEDFEAKEKEMMEFLDL